MLDNDFTHYQHLYTKTWIFIPRKRVLLMSFKV